MRTLILSGTKTRIDKLKGAPDLIPILIKILGHGQVATVMQNPYTYDMTGDGFAHTMKDVGKVVRKVAPIVDHASDLAILAGTYTANPTVVAAGAAGKAVAGVARAVTGGSKKNIENPEELPPKNLPKKALRYKLMKVHSL